MKTVFVQTILSGRASLKVGEESCAFTVPAKAPEGRRTPKPGGNSVAPLLALASWSAPALRRFRDQSHARKSSPAFNHPLAARSGQNGFDNLNGHSKLPALVGVVAQLVEHHNGIVGVRGSNPLGSTTLAINNLRNTGFRVATVVTTKRSQFTVVQDCFDRGFLSRPWTAILQSKADNHTPANAIQVCHIDYDGLLSATL